jgi:hypothetical protein
LHGVEKIHMPKADYNKDKAKQVSFGLMFIYSAIPKIINHV